MTALSGERFDAEQPVERPETFFVGATHAFSVQENPSGAPAKVSHVDGQGASQPDGSFRLDQTVRFDGQRAQHRTWLMRSVGEHAYRASLTDASGEIVGEAHGNLFHLRHPLKGVARMEQWLYLQPDGRTAARC